MDLHPALTSHCYGRLWKNIGIFNISLFGVERNPPCSVDKIQRGEVWPSSGGNMCRQCTNKVNILAFLLTDKGYGYHPWTWWEWSMEKVETLSSLDLWCFVCLFSELVWLGAPRKLMRYRCIPSGWGKIWTLWSILRQFFQQPAAHA